jgi:hypothetical protein
VNDLKLPALSKLFDVVLDKLKDAKTLRQLSGSISTEHILTLLHGVKGLCTCADRRVSEYLERVCAIAHQSSLVDIDAIAKSDIVRVFPQRSKLLSLLQSHSNRRASNVRPHRSW